MTEASNKTKGIGRYLLPLLLIGICFHNTTFAQEEKAIEAMEKAESSGFSGVLLLAKDGEIIFEKAVGYRSFEKEIPLMSTDVFEMASVSKQFTAMMIMMCAERGLLSYSDLMEEYLETPYSGITIRQLLTHTNGLPDYQEVMDKHWDKSKVADNAAILEYLRIYQPPMLAIPGEKYEYSNTGYVFLASIVEQVTGRDFIELSREWIFEPLGMTDTDIRTLEEKAAVENFAAGHLLDEEGKYINANRFHASDYTVWLGNRKGPGRISSTAHDLLRWDQALYTGKLVNSNTLTQAFMPMVLNDGSKYNYGFGWDLDLNSPFGRIVSHTGDNPGYRTIIIRLIDQNKTLIMLNNNAHESKDELINEALEALGKW
ncbi:serine hydrolase domain-containing protein [Cecembia lonarensis]|uniref:Penicillin-binding protein E n=1 Tax=Cecembia lonarensis (strain CCUG 58316 / KCTC 22772 / LW9) TaxID=1225176 RepID=K1LJ33_CECL9|nr:serine hydrolase domain-containing protein [Cecembia lonarensis]EKB50273.1 Penicillin-binding protein E [Cecembia lonarensis LW9]